MRFLALILLLVSSFSGFAQETLKLRVMTYNLRFGELASLDELAQHIKSFKPDLVALQEVDCFTQRERAPKQNGKNFISELAYHTGMYGFFGKTIDYKGGYYGIGILSRYPAISTQKTMLPYLDEKMERRALLEGIFEIGNDTLVFATTHLCVQSDEARTLQTKFICDHFANTVYPVILGGDFNAVPASNAIRQMLECWHADKDNAPSVSAKNPRRRIDFLFQKPMKGWKIVRSQVVYSLLSDHLPVVTDLEYKPNK